MRRIFKQFQKQLIAAEKLLTTEVMKRISPREAELLRDPALRGRVRFRFGGEQFPPSIYYKIFSGSKISYLSGKELITPSSKVFHLHGVQSVST